MNYGPCVGMPTVVGRYNGTDGTNLARSYYVCYDMSGNVSEWTSSLYGVSGYIYRGGGFGSFSGHCTTTFQTNGPATYREGQVGFRLALDPN